MLGLSSNSLLLCDPWELMTIVFGLLGVLCVYKVVAQVYEELTSPLRDLPGPPSKSWFFGHFKDLFSGDGSALLEQWSREYGVTFQYKAFFGSSRLYTTDLKAINHFLTNDYNYNKPEVATYGLKRVVGKGLLLVEGDVHRKQRKLLNPGFGPQQIRDLTEIFVEKSVELRDAWIKLIASSRTQTENDRPVHIDALSWLSRMTLDVIGLAGFNYSFDSLASSSDQNELSDAFARLFKTSVTLNSISALRGMIRPLRWIPLQGDTEAKLAKRTMRRIGGELLAQSKATLQLNSSVQEEKRAKQARDILSILVRANSMDDIPDSQKLNDEDVLDQIPTFLVAGHETTSVATTWALFALTQAKEVQDKLRKEISTVSTDNPTMDELNELPYLEAVVRETLRLHAPVPATMRVATKDDVVPLSQSYTDKKGETHDSILVKKGQTVLIPIVSINRALNLWGEDAMEFKPERWENLPDAISAIPGVWGNMMTFLGGPKACIGYRFSLVEMKALLFTLVRAFEFDLAVPATDIGRKASVTSRPVLLTADSEEQNQMPLLVSLVNG